jgi:phosphomannomutase
MDDIFLAYGVRGITGKTLNSELVKKIAWAFGQSHPGTILLAHDCRNSSLEFYNAAYAGLVACEVEVLPVGLTTTPMAIFGINHHKTTGGFVITASHNPPEWNGIKFFGRSAEPIGLENGLAEIRLKTLNAPQIPDNAPNFTIPLLEEYENFLMLSFETSLEKVSRPIRLIIDNGNGAASIVLERILGHLPWINVEKLFWEPDGSFPGRGPNPLLAGALAKLQQKVLESHADLGIAFDADGDRVFFVDEKGEILLSDWILAWLVDEFLSENPSEKIVIPIGSPRIVEDVIQKHKSRPIYSKVGFVSMRKDLKAENAIFGGERSGHYYFRDFFFADSGIWAMLTVLKFFLKRGAPISKILNPYKKYFTTGEINFEVSDRAKALELLKKTYAFKARSINELDGFFADFGDWWMLARPSNTEALLRIVIESADKSTLERVTKEVKNLISQSS